MAQLKPFRALRYDRERNPKQDMDAGIYLYEEQCAERAQALRGMICLVRLEDFAAGVILPQEGTLGTEKGGFPLMENFSQIYALYQDSQHTTRKRLENLAASCPPRYEASDGPVTRRLWVVNDPVAIEALRKDFADRRLYLIDGRDRYEAALHDRETDPAADHITMMLLATETEAADETL